MARPASSRTPAAEGDGLLAPEILEHFDTVADEYADDYARRSNAGYSFRIRKQRVLELFDKPGGKVLDVGCGPGVIVEELVRDRGCEFWGVDVAPEMVRQGQERYGDWPRVHFSVGSVEKLEFPDDSFDCVIAMGVLEYLTRPEPAVEEMYRVLKPGGTLIVTLPNVQSPFRIWQRRVWKPFLRLFTPLEPRLPIIRRLLSPVPHREFRFDTHRRVYEAVGGAVEDVVYYNFKVLPSPLDLVLRRPSLSLSARLERFGRSGARWIGTGFIVKVRKGAGDEDASRAG